MSIEIEKSVLEKACREMIETILFCLPNAFEGTIYRIGKRLELIAERITSRGLWLSASRVVPCHTSDFSTEYPEVTLSDGV